TAAPDAALAIAQELLPKTRGLARARALRLRGRSLTELDRAREAVPLLQQAGREARGADDVELATRTLFDLAVAHAKLEEPGEVLTLLLQCEGALQAGAVVDRTLELQ